MRRSLIDLVKRFGAGDFRVLLGLLLLGILFEGFSHEGPFAGGVGKVVVGLVILTSLRVVASSSTTRATGVGALLTWLVFLIVSSFWWGDSDSGELVDTLAKMANVLAFGWILAALSLVLLRMRRVDSQMLCASLCAYLMLGIWFFGIYTLLPEDSFLPNVAASESGNGEGGRSDLFYFSFVTLTSLGYGDVLPVSPIARSIATLEVVLGQFFLAVLIARQVGMFLVARSSEE